MRQEADTQYRLVVQIPYVTGKKSSVSQSTDGRFLVTAKDDEAAILWSADEGKPIRTFSDSSKIQQVVLSGDGKRVVTVSAPGPTIVWDATTGNKLQTFRSCTCAALSGDGSLIVTGYASGTAVLWEADSGFRVQSFRGHHSKMRCVAISPDGKYVVTGTEVNMLNLPAKTVDSDYDTSILWDATNGKRIRAFALDNNSVNSVVFSSDSKMVATGATKEAFLWEASSGKEVQRFKTGNSVVGIALSSDGKTLLTGSTHHSHLWNVADGGKIREFQQSQDVTDAAWSADGKSVWTAGVDGVTRLWDPGSGLELCQLHSFDLGKTWLVGQRDGHFDGPLDAWGMVGHQNKITKSIISNDATRRRFHRPGLLTEVWKGAK